MALSVGSPRPAVSGHPVRWSSDFPPSRLRQDGGRPAILDSHILASSAQRRKERSVIFPPDYGGLLWGLPQTLANEPLPDWETYREREGIGLS